MTSDIMFLKPGSLFFVPHVNDVISRLSWAPKFSILFRVEGDQTEALFLAYLKSPHYRGGEWHGGKGLSLGVRLVI